jgi:flavin-dependent dehydrogenase
MKIPTNYETDIAIIGGGVAGCIAAMSLAESYRVVLIDKLEQPIERVGECLAPAARRILRKLDLLEGMEKYLEGGVEKVHLTHMGTKSYWGSEHPYTTDHLRNPDGFGWHLNRPAFEAYLRQAAKEKGVECLWGMKLHNSTHVNAAWHLVLRQEEERVEQQQIRSRFVIDATGRQSYFARRLGVEREYQDKLISCWATFLDYEENKMARIAADKIGWWYTASLPQNRRVLALQTDSDLIDRTFLRQPSQFLELAKSNPAVAELLKNNEEKINFMGSVAANSSRLHRVCGPQWAALGDAAISFDPLSSQGIFNAMAGALQLSDLIHQMGVLSNQHTSGIRDFQTIYTQQTDRIWQHYLKHKEFFYRQEKRWIGAEFWKRRHG